MSTINSPILGQRGWGGGTRDVKRLKKGVLIWRQKGAIEQLLRTLVGWEFHIMGAATRKFLEPKHVWTRGTDNRLASEVCRLL